MASNRRKKRQHRIELFFVRSLQLILWSVPINTALAIADVVGWFIFSIVRIRRKVVLKNLQRAFPSKTYRERVKIAKKTYQNFTKMAFEYMRFPIIKKDELFSLCRLKGGEHIEWALKNGKGSVLVAGHFGNWELMGGYLSMSGYPISFLVGKQHNGFIDELMNKYRRLMGVDIIPMGYAVRGVIRALRNNKFVALLSDQDARRNGVFVDFFGIKASTPQGPAVFALKTGAPIIFGSAIRVKGARHLFKLQLLRFDHLDGITPENIQEVTQAYTSLLEQHIREHPDHWFWMHKRWKTRFPIIKN